MLGYLPGIEILRENSKKWDFRGDKSKKWDSALLGSKMWEPKQGHHARRQEVGFSTKITNLSLLAIIGGWQDTINLSSLLRAKKAEKLRTLQLCF